MDTPPTDAEREQLDHLHKSLYEPWGLQDIKEAENPRLAFVGLASWIDTVSRLSTGGRRRGEGAWRHFAKTYLKRHVSDGEIHLLYDGLRNALAHEYGTRGVALAHNKPESHWKRIDGILIFDLDSLIAEYDEAFLAFLAKLQRDEELRRTVLPKSIGLLAPVRLGDLNPSASQSHTLISSRLSAIAASATPGPNVRLALDDEAWRQTEPRRKRS